MKTIYRFLLALVLVLVFGRTIVFAADTTTAIPPECFGSPTGLGKEMCDALKRSLSGNTADCKKEYNEAAATCADFYNTTRRNCITKAKTCMSSGLLDDDGDKPRRESYGSKSKTAKSFVDFCTASKEIDFDSLEKRFDTAKDDLDKSETKLQELQDKMQEAKTKAQEKQDQLQEQIDTLQEQLTLVPGVAEEIKADATDNETKEQLRHIDAINTLNEAAKDIQNSIIAAGVKRDRAIQDLDNKCQLKEETTQAKLVEAKNAAKVNGTYTMQSLNQALTTSYLVKTNGKKMTRNEQQILERFKKCQESRLYLSGLRMAEQDYQLAVLGAQKTITSINNKLLVEQTQYQKMNQSNITRQNIALSKLATEQSNKLNKVMKLQQQKLQAQASASSEQQTLQGQMQQAQLKQMQQQQAMVNASQALSISENSGSHTKDDKKDLAKAMSILIDDDSARCAGNGADGSDTPSATSPGTATSEVKPEGT